MNKKSIAQAAFNFAWEVFERTGTFDIRYNDDYEFFVVKDPDSIDRVFTDVEGEGEEEQPDICPRCDTGHMMPTGEMVIGSIPRREYLQCDGCKRLGVRDAV